MAIKPSMMCYRVDEHNWAYGWINNGPGEMKHYRVLITPELAAEAHYYFDNGHTVFFVDRYGEPEELPRV